MQEKILNITNGDYFNQYFLANFGGIAVPFCEAMMDGEVVTKIYSAEFMKLRSSELGVSENEYRAKTYVQDILSKNTYSTICLWFGKDTFCQMNLLALLTYLEQIAYPGTLILNYIDDETFEVIESNIGVELGIYGKVYEDILISKLPTKEIGALNARAIDLYFDYHSNNGKLAKLVRENSHKEKRELIRLLLENSKEYGLSDLQAEKLINVNLTNR